MLMPINYTHSYIESPANTLSSSRNPNEKVIESVYEAAYLPPDGYSSGRIRA